MHTNNPLMNSTIHNNMNCVLKRKLYKQDYDDWDVMEENRKTRPEHSTTNKDCFNQPATNWLPLKYYLLLTTPSFRVALTTFLSLLGHRTTKDRNQMIFTYRNLRPVCNHYISGLTKIIDFISFFSSCGTSKIVPVVSLCFSDLCKREILVKTFMNRWNIGLLNRKWTNSCEKLSDEFAIKINKAVKKFFIVL